MPELPEVETVRRSLLKNVKGHKIIKVETYLDKLYSPTTKAEFIKSLTNQTINDVNRVSKWLIIELDDYDLLSHLRMEGKYNYVLQNTPREKHDYIIFDLDNGYSLRYNDTRQFGKMILMPLNVGAKHPAITKIGPEPWDTDETYLKEKLKNKRIAIKTALLDQTILAGLGNIYVNEVLFLSKIKPTRPANKLTKKELADIIKHSSEVMQKSIEAGGTTIHNFTSELGKPGAFQDQLLIHGKVDQPCPICKKAIHKEKVNGRGTYYCKNCQKK